MGRPPTSLALVAGVILAVSAGGAAQQGESPQPRKDAAQSSILFLSIDNFTQPYVRLMFEAFSNAVLSAPNAPAVYFESLDALRFQQRQYFPELREWLQRKYGGKRIDLVVTEGEDALAFMADAHGEPWPNAGLLYLESGSVRVDTRRDLPRAGGMLLQDHFVSAVGVIRTILPEATHAAVVYGGSAVERKRWLPVTNRIQSAGFELIELVGLSVDDLQAAVARLPAGTLVFILQPAVDSQGHVLPPTRNCELIATAASAPVFSFGMQDFGCGVVGGLMRDWSIIGRILGDEALARLQHPSDAVVSIPVARYTTLAFDDRQLKRWRIPEWRLPPGATVSFRVPSLWRDYRALVLAAFGVTLLQSFLIAGLVFERRRRRRAEMDSRRNLAALAHMDRRAAMGELATSLAHELNQPLNAILQNAGVAQMLLASNPLPPALGEMADIIDDIRKDDVRASEVIRRMRGLLQKHELESHPVDLNDVAQETIAIIQPDARARSTEIEVNLAAGMRLIRGDRVHLQQVLLNLLMNALDAVAAMAPERRRVMLWTATADGEMRLGVRDTGPGIPADSLAQIFEPFYTTKSGGRGMGMGLAIARGIVDAHAGRMGAENNADGGATVWFSVPVSAASRAEVREPLPPTPAGSH